jgi:hypothetical protein
VFSGIKSAVIWGLSILLFGVMGLGLTGCSGDRVTATSIADIVPPPKVTTSKLAEVSPPPLIQELKAILDRYQPQVQILSPKAGETLSSGTVNVQLQVRDLPTFQDPDLGLGPHIHLILDNQPYIAIYDPSQPYLLKDLTPGTHTLRVFATRPWHESFKNEGAYAQVTFNVLTQNGANSPDPDLPLLTYSRPKGEYGAEPIMLDYYLTNAPLHLIASKDEAIADWRIRVTVNGESFIVDSWQPIYLKGFQEGDNWVQLEFIDAQGDRLDNTFNNTVRIVTYHPNGQDTLSKITRGEVTFAEVRGIVDPNYTPTVQTEPEPPVTSAPPLPEVQPQESPSETTLAPSDSEKSLPETIPAPSEPEPDTATDEPEAIAEPDVITQDASIEAPESDPALNEDEMLQTLEDFLESEDEPAA